jgi:hypothetical protein
MLWKWFFEFELLEAVVQGPQRQESNPGKTSAPGSMEPRCSGAAREDRSSPT